MTMSIGTIPAGKFQRPIGNLGADKLPVPGQAAFGNLFAGALTIGIGEIGKMTATKDAADNEGRYASHTYG